MVFQASNRRRRSIAALVVTVLCLLEGCTLPPVASRSAEDRVTALGEATRRKPQLIFPERLDCGYTIVLPGIWGDQLVEYEIVAGLKDADVESAIELYDWTAGGMRLIYNLRALGHNRIEAQKIADKIVRYQKQYPNRPVHLIGYSGGGGVAVLALEALPPDHKVAVAVLLAPTLATNYNLELALSRTERGIRNFYSPLDIPILMVLGMAVGTTEGEHTLAAGAIGFEIPPSRNVARRQAYDARLQQEPYRLEMLADGHTGGHFGWANRTFVVRHVAPLLDPPTAPMPPIARDADRRPRLAGL